ncbi:MAG: acyl--CoA ligase [Clostridiales bacterium]|nr:acyl--CoA ligase [Clostridiales bacterium]
MTHGQTGYPSVDKPWLKFYSDNVINFQQEECTIYENLLKNNKDRPGDIALNYMGHKITYGELFESIDRTASAFINAGVKEGETVTIALPSIPEAIYCVYALNKIGAVANMIHPLAGVNETANYVNEVKSRVVVIFDSAYPSLKDCFPDTSAQLIIVASPADLLPFTLKAAYYLKANKPDLDNRKFKSWKMFISDGKGAKTDLYRKDCHKTALISHTGGTTGEPKGVMCSDISVNSLIWQMLCMNKYERQEVCMPVIPPFHNYSLVESMMAPLAVGYTVALIPRYNPEDFVKYVKKYHPNHVLSIPSYWEALLKIKGIEKEDLSCLKNIIYGGESMSAETEEKINKLLSSCGVKTQLRKGIGATEMVAGATIAYAECNPPDSVGIPMSKTNCKIVVPGTTQELSYNREGEICFSGPTLMLGYYNNPEATDEVVKVHEDGIKWFHTGDLGYINEDGIIFVSGRIKRILITRDKNKQATKMFPDRIEKAVCSHPAVDLCCVIGVPDEERVNYPGAFVVLKDKGESISVKDEILEICKNSLPEYMVPAEIVFLDDLPRTKAGKIDYRALENFRLSETVEPNQAEKMPPL